MDFDIKSNKVYEDDGFLVVDKPANLLVHPTKYSKEKTLVGWLLECYPKIKNIGQSDRPGIVHRLDRDVSGLMVVAKSQKAYHHLIKEFQQGRAQKKYLALVYGQPPEEKGMIELPIGRTKKGKLVAIRSHKKIKFEKPALTKYRILRKFKGYTLLEIEPLTGRTHQIRLHLRSIGCPIVGDEKYLPKHLITQAPKYLNRIFLHAHYLGFFDLNNKWREFKSSLPEELESFLWGLI